MEQGFNDCIYLCVYVSVFVLLSLLFPYGGNKKRSGGRLQMFFKIVALKSFAIFTGKHLCWSLQADSFIKKKLKRGSFLMNIQKSFRAHLWWLLLDPSFKL